MVPVSDDNININAYGYPGKEQASIQSGGTLENSGEMLGWELRELRLMVTKGIRISKGSQMRNKKSERKESSKAIRYKNNTDLAR